MSGRVLNAVGRVPVDVFRDKFLRLEAIGVMTRSELARQVGWFRKTSRRSGCSESRSEVPDAGRAARALGLAPNHMQRTVSYDVAVLLCCALDLDPVDVGI